MIAAAIAIPLSGSITRTHAQTQTTITPSPSPTKDHQMPVTMTQPPSTDHPAISATATNISITSTIGWQPTALSVQQGAQFAISYGSPSPTNSWTVDVNNFTFVGADGYTPNIDQQIYQGCKYDPSLPYATLLGQIGSGPSFAVSVGSVFTASASGTLSLRINDDDACLGDNAGSITVGVANVPTLAFPWSTTSADGAAVWYLDAGPHCDNPGDTCNIAGYEKRYALDFMPPGPAGCSSIDRINSGWVTAAASGTVVYAANNLVEIDHNGFRTGYYHLHTGTIAVIPGNFVTSGQHLGRPSCDTGLGGTATGIHVHFYICIQPDPQQICFPNSQNGTNIGGINIIGGTDIGTSNDGLMLSGWTTLLTSGNHNGIMTKPNQQNRTNNLSQCGIDDIGCGSRNDLPPNLLKNASFELDANADGKPDSWSLNSHFTRSSATTPHHCSVCGQNPLYVGRHQARNNSGYTISSNPVPNLTAGTAYTFIGWVDIPSTSDSFAFTIRIRWRNASNTTISTKTISTFKGSTGGAWMAAANNNLVAPTGTTNAQILMVVSSLNATIYVDDFLFSPN